MCAGGDQGGGLVATQDTIDSGDRYFYPRHQKLHDMHIYLLGLSKIPRTSYFLLYIRRNVVAIKGER